MENMLEHEYLWYIPSSFWSILRKILFKNIHEKLTAEEVLNFLDKCFYSEYHQHFKQ
jgi:hypothetical protein